MLPKRAITLGASLRGNVDDLADIQVEREAVGRAHGDGGKFLVEVVRLGLAGGPVQHDVGGRNVLHAVRVAD